MNPLRPKPRKCPICRQALEHRDAQWVCLHCLLIWHGDTFEPLVTNPKGKPPLDIFYP